MVRVINIDTKTRTIRVSNADGDIKTWRTTESGTHFPIKEGQTTKEALDKFVEKKRPEAQQEESPAMRAARESQDRMNRLKLAIGDKKNGVKKQQSAKKDENQELYDRIGEYAKTHKLPLDEQEHLVALRKMLKADKNSTEHVKRNFEKWFDSKKEAPKTASTESDSALVTAVAKALGTSAKDAETEINGAVRHIKDLIKAKDLRNGDVEETLQGLGLEPDYAEEFMQWVSAPDKKKPAEKKERNWWRGPRESEDAYFDRRDKTLAEARKIDKVSDWYKKAYAGDDAFPKNKDITFDELAKKMLDGTLGEFYEAVGVDESDVREKIFEELSERTGRPYDDFYDAWLHGGQKGTSGRAQKQKESVAYMDKLLELNTDMDPELRKMIVAARDRAKKELKKH